MARYAECHPLQHLARRAAADKTADEIDRIRAACGIADRAAQHIRRFIQPGMREREVAAELEWFMKQEGADKPSFDTIVASGPRGALPHGKASDKVIMPGEMITLDFGAQHRGIARI